MLTMLRIYAQCLFIFQQQWMWNVNWYRIYIGKRGLRQIDKLQLQNGNINLIFVRLEEKDLIVTKISTERLRSEKKVAHEHSIS